MTPETVGGMVKIAEESTKQAAEHARQAIRVAEEATRQAQATHAAPAQEATRQAFQVTKQACQMTRQSQEATKRDLIRYGTRGAAVALALVALMLIPNSGAAIVGIVGILSVAEMGSNLIDKWKKGGHAAT